MGAISQKGADFLIRSRLADAERGDVDALFELGVTYSTGRGASLKMAPPTTSATGAPLAPNLVTHAS